MQAGKHPQMTLTCHTVAMDVTAYVVSCKELVLGIGQGTLVRLISDMFLKYILGRIASIFTLALGFISLYVKNFLLCLTFRPPVTKKLAI